MNTPLFTATEIERLLKAAQSKMPSADSSSSQVVAPFDFLAAGQLTSGQVTKLVQLHVQFANRLGLSLTGILGCECQVTAAGGDQTSYGNFTKQSPDAVTFGLLRTEVPEGVVALRADATSILPTIDLIIGGTGAPTEENRPLTEVEQDIVTPLIRMIGSNLQAVWAPLLESAVNTKHYGTSANLVAANERVLLIKFDIQIGELKATWTVVLPAIVSHALARKVEQEMARIDDGKSNENQSRMRERLLDSHFKMELFLPPSTVAVRKLAHLKAGEVIVLKPRASEPIHFNLAGINLFQAVPVSCGVRRGAQIRKAHLSITNSKGESR